MGFALATAYRSLLMGLLCSGAACAVYDEGLVSKLGEGGTDPGGGASASPGANGGNDGGASGSGGQTGGGQTGGGQTNGGQTNGGNGGETPSGGTGGDSTNGGTGGTTSGGTGGSGGSGGTPAGGAAGTGGGAGTLPCGAASAERLDNFEALTAKIPSISGRSGSWFDYNDGTAGSTFSASFTDTNAPHGGTAAAYVVGSGLTNYGGGIGANIGGDPPDGKPELAYDLSPYVGFRYWAKKSVSSALSFIRLAAPTTDTNLTDIHNGANAILTTEWKQFSVCFADLDGGTTAFNPKLATGVQFQMPFMTTGDKGKKFEFWVDDIEVLKK